MEIINFAAGIDKVFLLKNIGNRGDGLIQEGAIAYFKQYGIEVELIDHYDNSKYGELLFIVGGGAFCHQWSHMIDAMERMYFKFENIVILPSSFDLSCEKVYNWASNLPKHVSVFCREEESFKQMSQVCKNVYLSIDTAFYINPSPYKKQGHGTLVSFRSDVESCRCLPKIENAHHREDISRGNQEDWKYLFKTVSNYEIIHTDRLHVAITAALLNKKVTLYSNAYFKNKAMFEYSLKHYPNINFVELEAIPFESYVSIVCAVMNREDTLKVSLSSWLKFKEVGEIIIVDWSSEKELSWVLDLDDRIKFIRVEGEQYFNISQAFNLGIDHATKEMILKMDVDYMLNPYCNFFEVNPIQNNCFYAGNGKKIGWDKPVFSWLNGLNYCKREYIKEVDGYNENFQGYGHDDEELCEALESIGKKRLDIQYDYSIIHIPHPSNFRTENYEQKYIDNRSVVFTKRRVINWNLCNLYENYIKAKSYFYEITINKASDPNWFKFEDGVCYDYSNYFAKQNTDMPKKAALSENGIYKINNGIVFHDGMCVSEKHQVYSDLFWYGGGEDLYPKGSWAQKFYKRKIHNVQRRQGKCLNLLTPWADINYGHFVLDCLTRLEIVENASPIKIEDFDYILLPKYNGDIYDTMIDFFKIPRNKIINGDESVQYQFEEMYSPSLRAMARISRVGSLNRIKEALSLRNDKPSKRLYISRKGFSRNIRNEDEVWSLLKLYGFEKINPKQEGDSYNLFNSATVILGPHGAGLTNMFCCPKDTKIIELVPYYHRYPWYMSLAHACNLPYYGLVCGDEHVFEVDLNELKKILEETGIDQIYKE
jgi:capsular polysaccharide biosynthesis protein/exopolysaccharide biosynthesis predicted pyruvyltransferase EpsI